MRISDWSSDVCSSDLLLHRAERPLDLALGAGRGVPVVGLRRQMGEDAHAEAAHHRLEHARPADRAVVHVDRDRQALERQFGLRLGRSEEHTSELQSLMRISYAVFCLKKQKEQKSTRCTANINKTIKYTL